jgi:hypothetical protein
MWIENCKGRPNGLGLETEGLEHKMDEMPEWDEKKIKRCKFNVPPDLAHCQSAEC